jgi:hypothetical protein
MTVAAFGLGLVGCRKTTSAELAREFFADEAARLELVSTPPGARLLERKDPGREGLSVHCEWRVEIKDGWESFVAATAKKLSSDYVCSTQPDKMNCIRRLPGDAFLLTFAGEPRGDRLLVLAQLRASPD